eukprot:3881780-Alexandrium_andersonii.AAC.1
MKTVRGCPPVPWVHVQVMRVRCAGHACARVAWVQCVCALPRSTVHRLLCHQRPGLILMLQQG